MVLFILSMEIMANSIRKNKNIQGVEVFGTEMKIKLYCDDVTLFSKGRESAEEIIKTLEIFERASGMQTNKKKSKVITNGPNFTPYEKVTKENPGQLLGFTVNNKKFIDPTEKRLEKLFEVLNRIRDSWSSILGKRLHIQSYGLSQLFYHSTFFTPTQDQYKLIQSKIKECLFKMERTSKKGKIFFTTPISLSRLSNSKDKGGIGLLNVEHQIKALQTVFVRQWLKQEGESNRVANRVGPRGDLVAKLLGRVRMVVSW